MVTHVEYLRGLPASPLYSLMLYAQPLPKVVIYHHVVAPLFKTLQMLPVLKGNEPQTFTWPTRPHTAHKAPHGPLPAARIRLLARLSLRFPRASLWSRPGPLVGFPHQACSRLRPLCWSSLCSSFSCLKLTCSGRPLPTSKTATAHPQARPSCPRYFFPDAYLLLVCRNYLVM